MAKYVYKDKEIVLTGRRATKPKRRANSPPDELVEIKPGDMADSLNNSYNVWVKESDLYEIVEDEKPEKE